MKKLEFSGKFKIGEIMKNCAEYESLYIFSFFWVYSCLYTFSINLFSNYEWLKNVWKNPVNSLVRGCWNPVLDSKRTMFESSQRPFFVRSHPANETIVTHCGTSDAWGDTGDLRSRPDGRGVFGIYSSSLSLSLSRRDPLSPSPALWQETGGVCSLLTAPAAAGATDD